jgi:hypothetical protein
LEVTFPESGGSNLPRRTSEGKIYEDESGYLVVEEYLTISEVATRLKIAPKTIKNKMAAGIFQKGVHYFSPQGLGPRFKWSAVVAWLEQSLTPAVDTDESIPMARGYQLGKSNGGLDTGR